VPVTVATASPPPSASGRSRPSSAGASSAACPGNIGKFSSRSTRAAGAGSVSAGPGAGGAPRTNVPRPTSPVTIPRRTSSEYPRAGDRLPTQPVSDARAIAELVPDAELVVVDRAAHLPNLEQPAAFERALSRLLGRVDRPRDRSATNTD
jgi:hypothetical protein